MGEGSLRLGWRDGLGEGLYINWGRGVVIFSVVSDRGSEGCFFSESVSAVRGDSGHFHSAGGGWQCRRFEGRNENSGMTMMGGGCQAELGGTHSQAELGDDRVRGEVVFFRSPCPLSGGFGHFHSAGGGWQCRTGLRAALRMTHSGSDDDGNDREGAL